MSKIDHRIIKASQIVLVEIPDEDQLDLQTYVRCQEHRIYKRTFNKNAKCTLNAEYLTSNLSQINLSFFIPPPSICNPSPPPTACFSPKGVVMLLPADRSEANNTNLRCKQLMELYTVFICSSKHIFQKSY